MGKKSSQPIISSSLPVVTFLAFRYFHGFAFELQVVLNHYFSSSIYFYGSVALSSSDWLLVLQSERVKFIWSGWFRLNFFLMDVIVDFHYFSLAVLDIILVSYSASMYGSFSGLFFELIVMSFWMFRASFFSRCMEILSLLILVFYVSKIELIQFYLGKEILGSTGLMYFLGLLADFILFSRSRLLASRA